MKGAGAPASAPWGALPDGRVATLYRLRNRSGMEADVTDYGAIVVRLTAPDREGRMADVVLGYDTLDGYRAGNPSFFGAMVGRCANRIAGGRFTLDGREHRLTCNDGPHHLHGGTRGFSRELWRGTPAEFEGAQAVRLQLQSPDGDEGYPGDVSVEVVYALTDLGELVVAWNAAAAAPTPVNLAHHSCFNLAGEGDVLGHRLRVDADAFTPVAEGLIPTGEIRPVDDTPMDLRHPVRLGDALTRRDEQLRIARGYDHNWALRSPRGAGEPAALLIHEKSGRTMTLFTTEPGLQVYTGNFLDGRDRGKNGRRHVRHAGVCLEAQHFPDAPNQPAFPPVILRPGTVRTERTVYRFGIA